MSACSLVCLFFLFLITEKSERQIKQTKKTNSNSFKKVVDRPTNIQLNLYYTED